MNALNSLWISMNHGLIKYGVKISIQIDFMPNNAILHLIKNSISILLGALFNV